VTTFPRFFGDQLHAPYFIFLRDGGSHSDLDLLRLFGLSTYQPSKPTNRRHRYVLFANKGPWTLIADDWWYTLWHMPSTRPTIATLGESCDVYACSVGDCDHSFDFVYYQNSRLVRQYVVVDPDFRSREVAENIGDPLPGESTAFQQFEATDIVLGIANALGIRTDFTEQEQLTLRLYSPA
jgi:hypothetical protein